jgi:hypothetical protein
MPDGEHPAPWRGARAGRESVPLAGAVKAKATLWTLPVLRSADNGARLRLVVRSTSVSGTGYSCRVRPTNHPRAMEFTRIG